MFVIMVRPFVIRSLADIHVMMTNVVCVCHIRPNTRSGRCDTFSNKFQYGIMYGARGRLAVKALCYKAESSWFDTR
jgi:hypothetical protein